MDENVEYLLIIHPVLIHLSAVLIPPAMTSVPNVMHLSPMINRTNRGYGFQILKLALEKTMKMGIEEVITTCSIANVTSKKTIEINNEKLLGTIFDEEEDEYLDKYSILSMK
ncbi:MAG: hypothetical protein ACTSYI_08495 [Promethearchaeota archaeon]